MHCADSLNRSVPFTRYPGPAKKRHGGARRAGKQVPSPASSHLDIHLTLLNTEEQRSVPDVITLLRSCEMTEAEHSQPKASTAPVTSVAPGKDLSQQVSVPLQIKLVFTQLQRAQPRPRAASQQRYCW